MANRLKGTEPRRRLCGGPPVDVRILRDFERWSARGKSYGDAIEILHVVATRLMHVDVPRSTPKMIRFRLKVAKGGQWIKSARIIRPGDYDATTNAVIWERIKRPSKFNRRKAQPKPKKGR